ncbi:uncharacterized protein [Hetaerina americana]|uniref:uncharacterized protein n=1 Tax=Hetaerina americana TaxID=62018 RepID=UPI003A7F4C9F
MRAYLILMLIWDSMVSFVNVVVATSFLRLVFSKYTENLTELRLIEHRCADCWFVRYNLIREGCNLETKNGISNGEERLEDEESFLSFSVDVEIKECDVDINQDGGGLGGDVSQVQDGGQGRDGAGKGGMGYFLHRCQICKGLEGFARKVALLAQVVRVAPVGGKKLKRDVCTAAFKCKRDFDGHVALVRSRGKERTNVILRVLFESGCFWTRPMFVWPFTSVCRRMALEELIVTATFQTYLTLVWSSTSVRRNASLNALLK